MAVYNERTLYKILAASLHPRSSLVPCLEAFIFRTAWQHHTHWYSIDFSIAALALVYWRSKKVCSYGCVWRTHLKQIFGSSSPSKKLIVTMLGGFHLSNCLAAASLLIFNWFSVAANALVYWRCKKVYSYGCVQRTHLKQIFGSFSPS